MSPQRFASAERAPLIAITPDCHQRLDHPTEATYVVRMNYAAALAECGALPVMLAYIPERIADIVDRFDGFLISGTTPGISEVPGRSEFEKALIDAVLNAGKPLMGICNGMQMVGLVLGGRLVDLGERQSDRGPMHLPHPVPDAVAHSISLSPESRLSGLTPEPITQVNSLHRQAIELPGNFLVAATAADGVVEAIEGFGPAYVVGTQWHPEYRITDFDKKLMADFVAAARTLEERR